MQDLIDEAARRFGVPAQWIAQIMQVESGGRATVVSPKGAIGLMQVMPETYAGLRLRYGLGADPWNPRDNVLAGAAYLREMYDRYGAAGMLAAYNAGPGRWEDYRFHARPLPDETVRYLARLGPVVGASIAPLPIFAGSTVPRSPSAAPIFVALASTSAPVQGAAERERIARIVEANATVIDRPVAIFVHRRRVAESPSNAHFDDSQPADQARSDRSAPASSPAPRPTRNPLFPKHPSAGSQP